MTFRRLAPHSLKTRISLATLSIFVISIWSLSIYASRMLRADMQDLLGEQQLSIVSMLAAEANQEIDDRMRWLESVAEKITPAMLDNSAVLQEFLAQRLILPSLFGGGGIIYRADGTAIADSLPEVGRVGVSYMDVDTVAIALKEGKSNIGKPIMGKKLGAPVFGMTVAIRDAQGKVIGAFAGVTNLGVSNFLDKIQQGHYGKTGGYLLVAPRSRLVITATDKVRIMEALPARGISPRLDRFIDGFEGTDVFVNPVGVEVLASAKGIPAAGWFLASNLPTDEAFAPIRAMQYRMLIATILLTLLAGGLTWWMLWRQFSPMLIAAETLAKLSESDQAPQPLVVAKDDEVGQLIGGFNRLLGILSERERALRENRERFDLAVRGSSDGIWDWNIETGEIYVADRWYEMLGYQPGEMRFGSRGWTDWIHPDDKADAIDRMRSHLKTRQHYSSEYRMPLKSGEYHWFLNRGQALWNAEGRAIRIAGSTSDITERKKSEERLHAFLENSAVIAWMKDAEGRYVFVSDNFLKRFGFSSEDVMGKSDAEVWPGDTAARIQGRDAEVLGDGQNIEVIEPVTEFNGRRSWWQKHKFMFTSSEGEHFVGGLGVDITEGKIAEEQLRKLSMAVEQSPESVVITNLNAEIEYVNEAFLRKTGYSREEVMGKNPRILNSGKTPVETFTALWDALSQGQPWKGDLHNRRKDGSEYIEHAVITPIHQPDGSVTHYVAVKEDITTQKASEERINTLAFYDPLTNLPNRRLLLDRLKQALASSARSKRYGALLFIDLDNFKTLNDTLGHDIGDLLLQQVSQRLITCVREGDTVARLGGDEFVVMLEDLNENIEESATQSKIVGEKILSTLNQPYQLANYPHHSTPSIGVTLFTDQQETIEELLKRADLAMYQAKTAGRNTLRFFDPEMQAVVTARAAMEADLREAVLKDQFVLHYQAQVVGEGRATGVEVLLRWLHPRRGMVSPADFIPLAEDTGLILPIGHWVLQTACAQLALWVARPELAHLTIAVNVSARQFRHKDFVDQVLAVLDHTGANPQRLKLELTESLLVDDVESVITKMAALKMKGVGFSMDDFGTGYSSLSYLKRLPLDQLKIDQGFVRDILTDANDAAIARMVVVLAESLGLVVIAEGVETEPQREYLAHHGCHAYQGYLFSRPLPLIDFERFACKAFDDEQRLLRG